TRQPDGKLVVAGYAYASGPPFFIQTVVTRFDASGNVDPSFGTGGITRFASSVSGSFVLGNPVQQPDRKIVLSGFRGIFGADKLGLGGLGGNGKRDPALGGGGVVAVDPGFDTDGAGAVVQPDGKIVAAGSVQGVSDYDVLIVRVDASGTLDPTFGTGGIVITDPRGGQAAGGHVPPPARKAGAPRAPRALRPAGFFFPRRPPGRRPPRPLR